MRATNVYEDFNDAQKQEIQAWLLDAETEKGRENAISPEEWGAYFGIYSKTARRLMDVIIPFPDDKHKRKRKMDFGARRNPLCTMEALAAAVAASTGEDMGNAGSSSGNCCCKSLRDDELGFDEVALHAVPRSAGPAKVRGAPGDDDSRSQPLTSRRLMPQMTQV